MKKFLIFAFVIALAPPRVEAGLFHLFGLLGSGNSDAENPTPDAQTVLPPHPPTPSESISPTSLPVSPFKDPANSTAAVAAADSADAGAQSPIYETSPDPQLSAMQPEEQQYYEGPPFDCSMPIPPTPKTPKVKQKAEMKKTELNEKCEDKYPKAVCENHRLFNHCHTMSRLDYYCERTCGYCTDECYNDDETCTQTQFPCDEAKSNLPNSACKARCGGCILPEWPPALKPPTVVGSEHKMFYIDNTLPAVLQSNPVPQWPFFDPGLDGGNEAV